MTTAVIAIRKVKTASIILGIIIVLVSELSFFIAAVSTSIKTNIVTANDLAVKLSTQLGAQPTDQLQLPAGIAPMDVVTGLQQYASTIRTSTPARLTAPQGVEVTFQFN